ncbi:hypothetical protein EW145_g5011 [Phellinidium pouzarii]|uniref:Histidine kinase n=1 Tax=Phellinidium pouzarii TaxID=167371 RepID=A0A4S4L1R7_9AGAM|nr:hypothetical protein EW145_g5011 [Phellinidium pouzarii]
MSCSLANLPYISFLTAYPHPAFILHGKNKPGHSAPSLNPVFGNSAFRSLLFGPDSDTEEDTHAFLKSLETVQRAESFGRWLDRARTDPRACQETLTIEMKLSWTPVDAKPIFLELTQTVFNDYTVCTSTPRSPLPKSRLSAPSVPDTNASSRIGRDFNMRLLDLPLPPMQAPSNALAMLPASFSALIRTPQSVRPSSRSPVKLLDGITQKPEQGMKEMVENYSWHLTPLGPRSSWSSSLRIAVSYIVANPYPLSVWWGPELVLLYNDAFKETSGYKHPAIFAEHGSVAWAEIWESIGPAVAKVFSGEAVAKRDDLLFINRMTDARLPEETYHSWNWVPIEEDGVVKGFINGTFENTSKIIAERRMLFLRDLANKAGLARTQTEFASTVLSVLRSFAVDCNFAAFYFASVKGAGCSSSSRPRTSYLRQSVDDSPVKIELRCAGTVGVPESHPSVPQIHQVYLDPVTLRPSATLRSKSSSPVPSYNSQDSASDLRTSTSNSTAATAVPLNGLGIHVHSSGSPVPSATSTSSIGSGGTTGVQKIPESAVIWPFAAAFSSRGTVHVPNIPDYVVEGFELRGWGEHAREAIVIPIVVDDTDIPAAVLVMGLNSRRPYDDDYASWIDLFRLSLNALLTAVKGREADLIRAEHLAELDSAKTAFFSNASHELRTPLTLIQGPLQDSIANLPESKSKDNLKMAARNVVRLSRLVDSLMDFSKLAANKLEGRFRPVQLGGYTADLASLFRSFWEKIVFNLIGNAFKYTMRGSLHVMLKYDNDYAYFHVKDTGVGIPQSDINKVFDRFHRVDAISRSQEGTGIGLALTKELVRLHGGNLSVTSITEEESSDDHGSCFTVSLPLGKDHLPPAHIVRENSSDLPRHRLYARGIVDEAIQWSSRQPDERTPSDCSDSGGSSESGKMDPTTLFFVKSDVILLVDDNADMRKYIKSLFVSFCQVVEASNGQEALHLLDSIKPNLILSDVMMPILDGYGLIAHVRERPDTRLTPIILVTAKESEEARVEGLLSGADDYMSKPFTGKELIARVHLQMQLGKRRIELEAKFLERTHEIQLLSDLSPVGICRADADRQVLYVNPRWYEISGHDPMASVNTWFDCVQKEDRQTVRELWKTAFETQRSSSLEFRFANGTYAKWSLQPLLSNVGVLTGLISTLTDVSDQRLYEASRLAHAQEREGLARKRAEEAEERRKEADERRRGQELLIDVTSHELRQPVSAILNCSSLVRSNLAGHREELGRLYGNNELFQPTEAFLRAIDDDLEALDAIYQCGLAQERIANDVLSLSRIQLQILSIHPVEFELIEEVQRIISIFRNELKMKRINLNLTFGDSFKRLGVERVRSDKSRFGQVITNLLSNGIKFTDTSSNKRYIHVTVDVSRRAPSPDGPCVPPDVSDDSEDSAPLDPDSPNQIFVFVAVKDSGPGLKPGDLALLFKRFQQGSNSHNVFGGSGLGLFVSRKLCDLMGGRIDVDSVYGEGATFRFFVEAITAPPIFRDRGQLSDQDPSVIMGGVVKASERLHILVTEDNLINQTVLNRQLLKAGCTTTLANNGLQAIEKAKDLLSNREGRKTFDVILMDCEMPVMDGLSAVREIRKLEKSGEFPIRNRVFALTGNARAGQIQSAREAGMDEVIVAVQGCCHGELDAIYNQIAQLEGRNNYKVDCLLICGDFQAIRNHQDLQCMAVPNKYKQHPGFPLHYEADSGLGDDSLDVNEGPRLSGPCEVWKKRHDSRIITQILYRGEGSTYPDARYRYHGGWLAPNIYFLGFAGCVQVNGVKIAGASGIYSAPHYKLGHFEKIPYDNGSVRSIYHTREYDIFRLSHLTSVDLCLSHDWPLGIEQYGDADDLLRRKPYFRSDVQSKTLGSPPAMQLLHALKPRWWFAAHLHCRFEATVMHGGSQEPRAPAKGDNPDEIVIDDFDEAEPDAGDKKADPELAVPVTVEKASVPKSEANPDEILLEDEMEDVALPPPIQRATKFLALDKCLPRRHHLEVVDIPSEESPETPRFTFDPEWLAITRAFHPCLSTDRVQPHLPDVAQATQSVKRELEWVLQNVGDKEKHDGIKDVGDCQVFWPTAPGPGSEGPNKFRQRSYLTLNTLIVSASILNFKFFFLRSAVVHESSD